MLNRISRLYSFVTHLTNLRYFLEGSLHAFTQSILTQMYIPGVYFERHHYN